MGMVVPARVSFDIQILLIGTLFLASNLYKAVKPVQMLPSVKRRKEELQLHLITMSWNSLLNPLAYSAYS